MNVSDLLQFLAAGRKTGMLSFERAKIVKQIYFDGGLIIASHSNDPREYLGQLLIHYGKINEGQLKEGLETQRKSGGRLGEILVATNVVPQADVLEVLRIRTLDIIYDLFLWDEAHFELHDNQPPPDYFIRIEIHPTKVIMDGVYRIDEWQRYRMLIPTDRTLLELGAGWTSSLNVSKEVRQLLFFVDKRMSVAEICYNMHASPFHVYGLLYDLVDKGIARIAGEIAEPESAKEEEPVDATASIPELLAAARIQLGEGQTEAALAAIQQVLVQEPSNSVARTLLSVGEDKLLKQLYSAPLLPNAVPRIIISEDGLTNQQLAPQEAFLLSRINGDWDVKSILSITPFREVDSLRMIKGLLDRGIIDF